VNQFILKKNYTIINLVFIGIIVSVIFYSVVYSANGLKHPVPSGAALIHDQIALSTGLSRSFSEIARLNFKQAKLYNPYGIRLFVFFIIQLFLRLAALVIIYYVPGKLQRSWYIYDAAVSILLFIVFFWPFIQLAARQAFLIIQG
jgi:hypothetical protein